MNTIHKGYKQDMGMVQKYIYIIEEIRYTITLVATVYY